MATELIDPRYYGVSGYGNVPAYALPERATGHLIYHPKGKTLCGAPDLSLHERSRGTWANLCKRCQKVAADKGLQEWVMPPLKKGECPVFSERQGKPSKHIMLPYRPRCKDCPEPKWNRQERCSARHRTYSKCSGCDWKDEDHHYCDETVGRTMGIATDFGHCNRRAYEQRHVPDRYHQPDGMVWHYLCKQHLPEAVQARRDASEAKMKADMERYHREWKESDDRDNAFDLLVDVARWVCENRDLAAEDEWLGQIAMKLAENEAVQKALA